MTLSQSRVGKGTKVSWNGQEKLKEKEDSKMDFTEKVTFGRSGMGRAWHME